MLSAQVEVLENKLHIMDTKDIRNELRVSGLPDDENAAKNELKDIIHKNLHLTLTDNEFDLKKQVPPKKRIPYNQTEQSTRENQSDKQPDQSTRESQADNQPDQSSSENQSDSMPDQRNKPKPIYKIKFNNYWKKRQIYINRYKFKRGVFVSEELTQEQSRLFYQCRIKKRSHQIKSTWTMDNKIYIRTQSDEQFEIKNIDHLQFVVNRHSSTENTNTNTDHDEQEVSESNTDS